MFSDSQSAKRAIRTGAFQFRLLTILVGVTVCAVVVGAYQNWGMFGGMIAVSLVPGLVVIWRSDLRIRTARNCAILYVIIGALGIPFLASEQGVRTPSRRNTCSNNLRQVALGLINYQDIYGEFPPAYTVDENGKPLHSWRTLLLPFLEQQGLYNVIRLNEPWDSPHNSQFHDVSLSIFNCPSGPDGWAATSPTTNYVAVVGPNTAWRGDQSVTLSEITDQHDSTILVVEVADSGIHWMEPRDLHIVQMAPTNNAPHGQGIRSHHRAGSMIAYVNGGTEFLLDSITAKELRAMLIINDGK